MDEQKDHDPEDEPHFIPAMSAEPDTGSGDDGEVARTPRKRLPAWAVAAIAVGIFVVAFLFLRYVAPGSSADAGNCASVTGDDDTAALTPLSCDDDEATFRVASTKDGAAGCPEGAYRELRDGGTLRCLMPNFREGGCYEPDDENRAFRLADCTAAEAIRVTRVIEGSSDPAPCPGGNGLGYPEPPVVYCLETPGT